MKKLLLSALLVSSYFSVAQTLETNDFNGLTLGAVAAINSDEEGQGAWFAYTSDGTTATTNNSSDLNFQVIAGGYNSTNGLQITGPNGKDGNKILIKDDSLADPWAARTSGNDVISSEFDFYTGPVTTSKNVISYRITAVNPDDEEAISVVNGFQYFKDTRQIAGLAYITYNGGGLYYITLASGGLILDASTWYRLGCSYNTITGELRWKVIKKSDGTVLANNLTVNSSYYFVAPTILNHLFVDFADYQATATNTVAGVTVYDDMRTYASSATNLLSVDNPNSIVSTFSMYPNPVKDVLTVSDSNTTFASYSVIDVNGRVVKAGNVGGINTFDVNTSDLNAGVYMLQLTSDKETFTKKFIKE